MSRVYCDGLLKLNGVDPRLTAIMLTAAYRLNLAEPTFQVRFTWGLRSLKEQAKLFADGKSRTMDSYHLVGRACDVAMIKDGFISWDVPNYARLNNHVQAVAGEFGEVVTWGGVWSFVDATHFQLEALKAPPRIVLSKG